MSKGQDRLTGLLDRNGGYAIAGQRVVESHLNKIPLSVLWIDVDRFHAINHSFGHHGGDLLVKSIAKRMHSTFGRCGDLARMSGDEFLLILPGADLAAATETAQSIEAVIAQVTEIDGVQIHPTASIGVAVLEDDEDAVRFMLRADKAKTVAKQHGGNKFLVSGERLANNGFLLAREELEIEAKLHRAIDTGGLQLHYQPIVRPDGTIEAVEALMRCTVDGESIPPVKLIPVAEKTGLIARLGEWTICEGAGMARRLLDSGYSIKVAVNVSRVQLLGLNFLSGLHAALLCANIPPSLLELELTESLFLDASSVVQMNLQGARETGVGLAIDDFGTGYSSLATLKDVPATKLKLDRSFIVVLPDDQKAFAVVRAMANLGRELGLTIVAEGVETLEQKAALEQIGVDAIQGYLYSPPISVENLLVWLKDFQNHKESKVVAS